MASGYVPPHKRNEPVEKKKIVSLNSKDDFPDLSLNSTKASAWGSKTSFSQKIKDLIVYEQKTEAEREAEKEAARAIEGWIVLNIQPFTKERYILFNERLLGLATFESTQFMKVENKKSEFIKEEKIASPTNEASVRLEYDSPSESEDDFEDKYGDSEAHYNEPYENGEDYDESYDKYY